MYGYVCVVVVGGFAAPKKKFESGNSAGIFLANHRPNLATAARDPRCRSTSHLHPTYATCHQVTRGCCADDRDMLDFMENVQHAFYEASHWNVDNSYGALNATARGPSHIAFR